MQQHFRLKGKNMFTGCFVVYGNYKGTKTSKITILKSAKKYDQMYGYISKGKMSVYVKVKGKWYKA